jgi:hypothetical protein
VLPKAMLCVSTFVPAIVDIINLTHGLDLLFIKLTHGLSLLFIKLAPKGVSVIKSISAKKIQEEHP